MGAAASVAARAWDSLEIPNSALNSEIKKLCEEAEALKQAIAEDDYCELVDAMSKHFKPHTAIIKRLTSRTKSQLARLDSIGNGTLLKNVFKVSPKYGNFLKCCSRPSSETSTVLIRTAVSGIGCDDQMLLHVICSSTPAELVAIDRELGKYAGLDNIKKVAAGNAKDDVLKNFFKVCFAADGFERKDLPVYVEDNSVVKKEAEELQELLSDFRNDNLNRIFSLLVTSTRMHTCEIADAFKEASGSTLEKAIKRFFTPVSPLTALALNLWICSVPRAIAKMLFAFSKEIKPHSHVFERIFGVISRHDKAMLVAVDAEYRALGADTGLGISLSGLITQCMTGKLALAVDLWCSADATSCTPDKGVEDEVRSHLNQNAYEGRYGDISIDKIAFVAKDDDAAAQIKAFLQLEVQHLSAYKKAHVQDREVKEWVDEAPSNLLPDEETAYHDALSLMNGYFTLLFTYYDRNHSGLLEAGEFWGMVDELQLNEFGFTPEDVASMKQVNDWDIEGAGIAYDEVIHELSITMFRSCKAANINIGNLMDQRIARHAEVIKNDKFAEAESANPSAIRQNKLFAAPKKMPPHIETWIHQTFNTYDVDKNGVLDMDEFMRCLSAMNLGTTEDDLEKIRKSMDQDGDAKVTWEEAVQPFTDIILSMTNDSRDHWIGLVDAESGFLFWYNLKDGNSIWMTEEDQEAYKAKAISSPSCAIEKQESVAETQTVVGLQKIKHTSMYFEDDSQEKLAKLRQSEAKAMDVLNSHLGHGEDQQRKALRERLAKKKNKASA